MGTCPAFTIWLVSFLIEHAFGRWNPILLEPYNKQRHGDPVAQGWDSVAAEAVLDPTEYTATFCKDTCRPAFVVMTVSPPLPKPASLEVVVAEAALSTSFTVADGTAEASLTTPTPFISFKLIGAPGNTMVMFYLNSTGCLSLVEAPCRNPYVQVAQPIPIASSYLVSAIVCTVASAIALLILGVSFVSWCRHLYVRDKQSIHPHRSRAVNVWDQDAQTAAALASSVRSGSGGGYGGSPGSSPTASWDVPPVECVHSSGKPLAPSSPRGGADDDDEGTGVRYGTYTEFYEALRKARLEEDDAQGEGGDANLPAGR